MSDYILSCCSTIDLTNEWVKDRDLHYIPFNSIVDGQQYKDDMGLTFSPQNLYKMMEAGAEAKTSQVGIGEYLDYFTPFLEEGKDILHVSLSTGI